MPESRNEHCPALVIYAINDPVGSVNELPSSAIIELGNKIAPIRQNAE